MLGAITGILAVDRNPNAAVGVLSYVPIVLSESPNTARAKVIATTPISLSNSPNSALGTSVLTASISLSNSPNSALGISIVNVPVILSQPGVSAAQVVLYLKFNGTEGSTTFTDSSPSAHVPVNVVAPLSITNVGSKFNGSGNFTGGYIQYADSEDWNYGAGDFTIEFWANWNSASVGSRSVVFGQGSTNGGQDPAGIMKNTDGTLSLNLSFADSTSLSARSTNAIVENTWYHVAAVRSGINFYLWVNGVLWTSTTSAGTLVNSPSVLGAGIDGAYVSAGYGGIYGTRMMGLLDEFRITKGGARYTAPFTPPTSPF